jgi:hypothetical protein
VTPAANDKLGKLIRMLSPDRDGEVLAAASAIRRTLAAEGSDIHALGDTLCPGAARGGAAAAIALGRQRLAQHCV